VLFCGLILTAAGSAYYHLAPDNARLVWDRLPMTMVFMSLVAAIVMERIDLRAGLVLLPILLLVGAAGHIVSGHTLKHIAAAGAGLWIIRMLQMRQPLSGASQKEPFAGQAAGTPENLHRSSG
jgi:hypothetical protein